MKKKINLIITILSCLIYVLVMFIFDINLGTGKKELENILIIIFPCLMFLFYLLYYEKDKNIIWYYLMLYITMLIGFTFSNNRVNYLTINNILKRENNLIPFVSMINLFKYSKRTFLYNALGNLLMLTPLAVLLPLLSDKFKRVKNYFLCVVILTITIESAQYIFKLGSFDIDDIILNVGGTVLFYIIIYKSKLKSIINKIFLTYKSDKKVFKYLYYLSMIFSIIVIIYYIFLIFTNIYENKIDYQNLKCIQNNKEFIVKINNDNYYSLCKYEGFIKKGNIKYSIKESLENNFLKESDLKKLNIINEEFITNVKIIEDNKIKKISNSNYTYYLVNIKDMIYHFDEKNESIYDLMNTENVNDYIFSLVKISYFSNDKIMTAYSGKYFDVINCTNINEYYIVSKDYEYDENFCKKTPK